MAAHLERLPRNRRAPAGSLLDQVLASRAAELLHACLDPVCGEVALIDPTGVVHRLEGGGFRRVVDEPAWSTAGTDAIATRAPAERPLTERLLVAAPIQVDDAVAGSIACACRGVDPVLLRALVCAAARAVGELAARTALDTEHARLLGRAQEARADAEAAQRRLAFLDEASAVLFAAPLDAGARLDMLAKLAVPDLADWCWVDLLAANGRGLDRSAVAHWNPAGEALAASERGRHILLSDDERGAGEVLATGSTVVIDDMGAHLRAGGADAGFFSAVGAKSALVMPLRAVGGARLGTMTFVFAESNRRYAEADLDLASDLAGRAALAVENARLYQQAEQAVRARDEMLAVVSHDLRNPLSAILANAGVLGRKLPPGEEGDRIRKHADAIRRSAERMNHLIRDLLDLAGIESHRLQVDIGEHELGVLVGEAVEMFLPLASERQITLTVEMEEGSTPVVCDRERVLQVLSNLLGNAVKFTQQGGAVRLTATPEPGKVRLGVSDTGPGIAAENLENIFDRYWQVRASGRAGAGLGLSIARGIVQAHGGHIWAESEPGRGSTFWFTLPTA